MKKKNKAGIIAAVIVLGVLCVAMIAGCILAINGSTGKLSQKSSTAKKSDFEETEETYTDNEYYGDGKDFEVVINEAAPEETPEEGAEAGQEAGSDYLCAVSNHRELREEDVTALQSQTVEGLPADKGIIQMVINEMYARRGYQFGDEAIQAYFDSKAWYQEITDRTDDMDAILADMSEIEKTNIDFLSTYVQ